MNQKDSADSSDYEEVCRNNGRDNTFSISCRHNDAA